jgi:hypothetical protein
MPASHPRNALRHRVYPTIGAAPTPRIEANGLLDFPLTGRSIFRSVCSEAGPGPRRRPGRDRNSPGPRPLGGYGGIARQRDGDALKTGVPLVASARRRHEEALSGARTALRSLETSGEQVTYAKVAVAAQVSRTLSR